MTIDGIFNIFYGLIQGITEFIPISSSGHLNIIEILKRNSQIIKKTSPPHTMPRGNAG